MRTDYCGNIDSSYIGQEITLCGWVNKRRDLGGVIFIDLRDREGIVQVVFDPDLPEVLSIANKLRGEFCVKLTGKVRARPEGQINKDMRTGEIEILGTGLEIINRSDALPLDWNQENSEEQRLRYRYLDLRRPVMSQRLQFRAKVTGAVRRFLEGEGFLDIETPILTKATPEGARDFVVPSRMNEGQFYALPQSPQTFKQLLMVGGMDKYFQIVKCFRDEDLRADRQPEFTQIDCEMAFIEQEDILNAFEGLTRHLLKEVNGVEVEKFPRLLYDDAMRLYGNDKPDIRFGMEFGELNEVTQHKDFGVFNAAELVVGIAVPGGNSYTRKEIDKLIDWVKRPQIGALGMVYCRYNEDGSFKSSVDKFYDQDDLAKWAEKTGAKPGDLICVLSGNTNKVRAQLSALRMEMATRLGLRDPKTFAPLWVMDFPLLEWDEDTERYHAMHHPFTSPKPGQLELLKTDPGAVKANAYDLVLNGNEIGGGSIRIHDKETQALMFDYLGFTPQEAKAQFGFLMDAFQYGAPPHGGLAFGLDRLVAILGGQETIRDFIAFPKNNNGRDVMIDAPAPIDDEQLTELSLKLNLKS